MNYFWILTFSTFCGVLSAAISKMTQSNLGECGVGIEANMFVIVECGVLGSIFLYCMNGAVPMKLTAYTFVMATVSTVLANASMPFTFKALALGDISSTKLITTVGCMILPYLFGIVFLKEATTAIAVCGVIILAAAIAVPILIERKKQSILIAENQSVKFYLYCCLICILSSASSIVNKLYWELDGFEKNTAIEFSFISYLMGAVVAAVILAYRLIVKKQKLVLSGKYGVWFIPVIYGAESVTNALSYYMQMTCVEALPASVFTPLSTGLGLILTALMAWIVFREKPTKVRILSILAAVLAIRLVSW